MKDHSLLPAGRIHFWNHLTAAEIQSLAATAVTILPTASTEQHGPHMVTGTDTFLNDLLQEGLAKNPPARGEFLLLPTLPLGTSEHHVPFGGTLTIPPILYTQVLVAILRSLIRQGHKRIFILNSHGGNIPPITTALAELALECTEGEVLLGAASYWNFCEQEWRNAIPDLKLSSLGHACEIEASLLMLAQPKDHLRSQPPGEPYPTFVKEGWLIAASYPALSASGFIGYPGEASLEKGKTLLQIAVARLREFLAAYFERELTRDLRNPPGTPS
jgi:creatinine amidohydrolase